MTAPNGRLTAVRRHRGRPGQQPAGAGRSSVVLLTDNYGEAGAIDRFGPALGLPRAHSGHNAYALWGPAAGLPDRSRSRRCGDCGRHHPAESRCVLRIRAESRAYRQHHRRGQRRAGPNGVDGREHGSPGHNCGHSLPFRVIDGTRSGASWQNDHCAICSSRRYRVVISGDEPRAARMATGVFQ